MQRRQKDPLQIEADLFAAIATMDQLSKYFDKGLVEETLYRRQLKSCISDVFKARMQLEKSGFNITEFIARENIEEKYPEGMRRLDLAEGLDEESVSLEFKELKELPVKSADYVANAIELVDLLKLRTVAKIEYIVPLLDDMHNILSEFPNFGSSHWCVIEIDGWRKSLLAEKPSMVLPEEQCEKIEFDAVRWLNEFRRTLKEL
ncbi:MAG: hypothetical protein ACXAB7_20390 [Candidatus Kariarchaeaceae archaeon]|jgi:hypothetical protein